MGALRVCCYKTHSLNLDATLIRAVGKIRNLYLQNRAEQSGARQKERKEACEREYHKAGLAAINGRGWEGKGTTAGKQNDGSDWSEAREKKQNKHNIWQWMAGVSKWSFLVHVQRQHAHTTPPPGRIVVMATTHIGSAACPWLPERAPEAAVMRWGGERDKNPSWIITGAAEAHKWSGREGGEDDQEEGERDRNHRFVCSVRRPTRYWTRVTPSD